MRVVRVKEESSSHTLLWVAAGAIAGFAAGVIIAEKRSGRRLSVRGLIDRGRRLVTQAVSAGGELLDAAQSLRQSLGEEEEPEEDDEDLAEEGEEEEDEDGEEETSDDELGSRVLEAFENDPILAARSVEIQSDDTTILLHGRVHSAREVQHAVTIARGVPGVVEVRQRLKVRAGR